MDAAAARAGNRRKLAKAVGIDHDYLYRYATGRAGMKFDATVVLLAYMGWLGETATGASRSAARAPEEVAALALVEASDALRRAAAELRGQAAPRESAN